MVFLAIKIRAIVFAVVPVVWCLGSCWRTAATEQRASAAALVINDEADEDADKEENQTHFMFFADMRGFDGDG